MRREGEREVDKKRSKESKVAFYNQLLKDTSRIVITLTISSPSLIFPVSSATPLDTTDVTMTPLPDLLLKMLMPSPCCPRTKETL